MLSLRWREGGGPLAAGGGGGTSTSRPARDGRLRGWCGAGGGGGGCAAAARPGGRGAGCCCCGGGAADAGRATGRAACCGGAIPCCGGGGREAGCTGGGGSHCATEGGAAGLAPMATGGAAAGSGWAPSVAYWFTQLPPSPAHGTAVGWAASWSLQAGNEGGEGADYCLEPMEGRGRLEVGRGLASRTSRADRMHPRWYCYQRGCDSLGSSAAAGPCGRVTRGAEGWPQDGDASGR